MKKEKNIRDKNIKIDQLFDAYEEFLKKAGINERESTFTKFSVTKGDTTTGYETSREFFAKVGDSE